MRIRRASIDDLPVILTLMGDFLKEEHQAGSLTQPGERTLTALMRLVAESVLRPDSGRVTLLAEEGEKPLGFTLMAVEDTALDHAYSRVARTAVNYVLPEARRQGTALELIHAKERIAKEMGCQAMFTHVRLENDASMGLVTKAGYRAYDVALVKDL